MKCPICKKGKIAYCQDAIVPQTFNRNKKGGYNFKPMTNEINFLDNTWIECNDCKSTSNDNSILADLLQRIEA